MATTPYDPSEYLDTPEAREEYLLATLEECNGDPGAVLAALGVVARSIGMSEIAERIGVTRQGLYVGLSENGNPRWETVWKVADELGLELAFRAKASGE